MSLAKKNCPKNQLITQGLERTRISKVKASINYHLSFYPRSRGTIISVLLKSLIWQCFLHNDYTVTFKDLADPEMSTKGCHLTAE